MHRAEKVGTIKALYRYPVKSMRGQSITESHVYWYGLDGDRRYAFVRGDNQSGFPWLTGRQVSQLVQYAPQFTNLADVVNSPVLVQTPNGRTLPITSPDLRAELATAYGSDVYLIKIGRGAFDAQQLSLMSSATANALAMQLGDHVDAVRFRQNIIIDTVANTPFAEESWLDGTLTIGTEADSVRIRLNRRIQRCAMITIDPETAVRDPQILRHVTQQRDNCVGVYASVEQPGTIRVGDALFLQAA